LLEILNSLVSKSHAAAPTATATTTDAGVAAEEGRSESDITLLR